MSSTVLRQNDVRKFIRSPSKNTPRVSKINLLTSIYLLSLLATMLAIVVKLFCVYPDEAEYDCIVVGAGGAGATVAGRLAQNKTLKVLLIECGGDPPLESYVSKIIKKYKLVTVSLPHLPKIDWRLQTYFDYQPRFPHNVFLHRGQSCKKVQYIEKDTLVLFWGQRRKSSNEASRPLCPWSGRQCQTSTD